jgi:hypothetical protein
MANKPKPLSEEFIARALEDVQHMVQATRDVMDIVGLPPEDEPWVFDALFKGRNLEKVLGQAVEETEEADTVQLAFTHPSLPPDEDERAFEVIRTSMRRIDILYSSERSGKLPLSKHQYVVSAYTLYKRSGVHLDYFLNLLEAAAQATMRNEHSVYNRDRIGYFFDFLEQRLPRVEPWKQADTSTKAKFPKDARKRRKQ